MVVIYSSRTAEIAVWVQAKGRLEHAGRLLVDERSRTSIAKQCRGQSVCRHADINPFF